MSLFASESLETLRERVDLVEVLSGHMELKRQGSSYKGLCPFHDEKTPSFVVRQGDRHYHCFGCGAHGDAIAFLMERLQMSFSEAVESLAQKFGVPLRKTEGDSGRADSRKKALRSVLCDASRFYHYALMNFVEAQLALQYLFGRGIDLAFIRRFQLGYAPSFKGFQQVMGELGHNATLLKEAGLIGNRGHDFFIDRILFPIRDPTGNVVGFSGRRYKEAGFGGKYINTPETPLFHKSQVLFGLHESRRQIAKERSVLIVEGQLDCLRLIHTGLDTAVAPLGTALTKSQVQALQGLGVRKAVLAFDADDAGADAAAKAGHLLHVEGIGVHVAQLPQGVDPDALLLSQGPEVMMQTLDEARDFVPFLVGYLSKKVDPRSPSGKAEIAREVKQRIDEWKDPVVIHESLRRLARILDLPEEMVGVGARPLAQVQVAQTAHLGTARANERDAIEDDVIRWLVLMGEETPPLIELVTTHLTPELFRNSSCRAIFIRYLELYAAGEPRDLITLSIGLEDQEALASILQRRVNRERVESQFCQALQALLERGWMERREAVRRKIQGGGLEDEAVMALAKEFDALKKERPEVQWPG